MKRVLCVLALGVLGAVLLLGAGCGKKAATNTPKNDKIFEQERAGEGGDVIKANVVDGECVVCGKKSATLQPIWSNRTPADPNPDPLIEKGVCSNECSIGFRQGKAKGFRLNPDSGMYEMTEEATK